MIITNNFKCKTKESLITPEIQVWQLIIFDLLLVTS